MRVSIFLLLASLALLTVSIVHSSDVDSEIEWIQPAFVEEAESSVSDWDALVARAYDAYLANPTPSHAMMETAVGVEAQVAATLTAHGKTEAELLAELEQRSPNLWAEFKAKFQSLGVKIDNDAARFKVFALNLLTVAKKNAAAFFSHVAREHRAVFSHMTPFAHLTVAEFKSMNKLRAHRPARRSLLQVDAGADLDLDAELDAEAEVDSEEAAEDALEAEEDAKAASFLEMELPGPGQACGAGGTCTAQANWCAAPKHLHHGLCSGTAICCEPPGAAAPVTPQPAPAAPAAPASGVAPDFDWRAKGTAIKYQVEFKFYRPEVWRVQVWSANFRRCVASISPLFKDQCGCCFAFATASVLESRWNIKHGLLETLSPQQVMDCVAPKAGCSGGDILQAAENYVDHGAALTEAQYPFLKAPGPKCSYGAAGAPRPTSAAPYGQCNSGEEICLVFGARGPRNELMPVSLFSPIQMTTRLRIRMRTNWAHPSQWKVRRLSVSTRRVCSCTPAVSSRMLRDATPIRRSSITPSLSRDSEPTAMTEHGLYVTQNTHRHKNGGNVSRNEAVRVVFFATTNVCRLLAIVPLSGSQLLG